MFPTSSDPVPSRWPYPVRRYWREALIFAFFFCVLFAPAARSVAWDVLGLGSVTFWVKLRLPI